MYQCLSIDISGFRSIFYSKPSPEYFFFLNDAEMLKFYKDSITELKSSNMSLNDDIKALERRNDEDIANS